jgi:hypothetical protein
LLDSFGLSALTFVCLSALRSSLPLYSQTKEEDPVFQLDFAALKTAGVVTDIAEVDPQTSADDRNPDVPYFCKEQEFVTTWKANPKVQMALANYASQYKKTESCKQSGRTQCPMQIKEGKEQTDEMFSSLVAPMKTISVDLKDTPGGSAAANTTWLFGSTPRVANCSLTPFGLASGRFLAMGKARILMCSITSLKLAFEKCG